MAQVTQLQLRFEHEASTVSEQLAGMAQRFEDMQVLFTTSSHGVASCMREKKMSPGGPSKRAAAAKSSRRLSSFQVSGIFYSNDLTWRRSLVLLPNRHGQAWLP
ncbi:uncharacterized protein N7473_005619 [Penicillium subrubescens]|jgi:hypothetical protein|uniref:uncharacterized protein n=1 Tax=Penicillium subrubescens TaxID=1316194 RepID=UPI002545B39E|nr:uncharacterized protein N7473_005619 [Penicillium subrubescens]KAJ5896220.1 hypothetical protein N7473_005619 [Penicillium subrubescens]